MRIQVHGVLEQCRIDIRNLLLVGRGDQLRRRLMVIDFLASPPTRPRRRNTAYPINAIQDMTRSISKVTGAL